MYKQYWNDYEKRAEQIRKAARAVESGTAPPSPPSLQLKEEKKVSSPQRQVGLSAFLERFTEDDILLLALLFLLITCEEKDTTMIIILGYLLLSGF